MEFSWGNASKGPFSDAATGPLPDAAYWRRFAAPPSYRNVEQREPLPIKSNSLLQNDGCSIHEGHAVKRALLFAGQPLLPWLGQVIPARGRREHAGNRRVDEGRRVTEDPGRWPKPPPSFTYLKLSVAMVMPFG